MRFATVNSSLNYIENQTTLEYEVDLQNQIMTMSMIHSNRAVHTDHFIKILL